MPESAATRDLEDAVLLMASDSYSTALGGSRSFGLYQIDGRLADGLPKQSLELLRRSGDRGGCTAVRDGWLPGELQQLNFGGPCWSRQGRI